MNKDQIVRAVAKSSGFPIYQVEKIVEEFLFQVSAAIVEGGGARLHGFGKIESVFAPPRTGRNVKTGEKINIPARRRVKFTPSENLKMFINAHAEG